MSTRVFLAFTAAALTVCATGCGDSGGSPATPVSGRGGGFVAAAFQFPPAWPGVRWARNGTVVPWQEIAAAAGPEHCQWQSVTFLTVAWPLGTRSADARHARQYLRDPRGVLRDGRTAALDLRATLPPSAHATGYRTGNVELWLGADADRYAYLVNARDHSAAERWPRGDPMTLCD